MRLALFSHGISKQAGNKLLEWIGKKPGEIKAVLISTPVNLRPEKPKWYLQTQDELRSLFPNLKVFDVEQYHNSNFDFKKYFEEKDVIYISGGSPSYLSYWMKKAGADEVVKGLAREGKVVYAGESAGIVYLLDDFSLYTPAEESVPKSKSSTKGIGLIDFAPLPHWNDERFRSVFEGVEKKYLSKGIKTYRIKDGEALFVEGGKITKVK